jgi:hypothetical protein
VRSLAALPLLLALALVSCGNDRSSLRETRVSGNDPVERARFPRYGVSVEVPRTAGLQRRPRPGVFRVFLGEPFVSMFAYRRKEQIPRKDAELRDARRRLIKQVERRDPDFKLRGSRVTEVAGARAVELVGEQVISSARLRTRSVHVYKHKSEYVIELLAPPKEFARTDRALFEPLLRSLKLSGEVKAPKGKRKRKRD